MHGIIVRKKNTTEYFNQKIYIICLIIVTTSGRRKRSIRHDLRKKLQRRLSPTERAKLVRRNLVSSSKYPHLDEKGQSIMLKTSILD